MVLIPPTMRHYQRSWVGPDLVAGLTLAAIAVPEQMATARLANMPAVVGLYAFLAGSVAFALLGSNRRMSVGADSTITPIFAVGVATIAAVGTTRYADLVMVLALLVGALVAAVGLLRLGWIADFLPAPVVTGVLGGIAAEILVRQLPTVLGLPGGGTTTVGRLREVIDQRNLVNGWAVAIAAGVLVVVLGAERIDRRAPGALIGLALSIAAVLGLGLKAHGVHLVGSFHAGLPSFRTPSASVADVRRLIVPALTVAFVCVVQTAATARSSVTADAETDDFNRDLVALGAGNVLAGLTGSFAVNASPPRTAVVTASGGRSQAASLVAAVVVAAVLFASGVLKDLPDPTLGAILIFVATRLLRVGELRRILRFDPIEFAIAVVTLLVVGLLGIEQGVLVAIVLAMAQRVRLTARPRDAVLGCEPGTDHWLPIDIGQPTQQISGVLVYMLHAPLWYGNANFVVARIRKMINSASQPVHALVLDADGISDIDYTGARALAQFNAELRDRGVLLYVARSSQLVHHNLKRSGLLKVLGADHLFPSVQDAVSAVAALKTPPGSAGQGGST